MAKRGKGGGGRAPARGRGRRSDAEAREIEALERRLEAGAPPPASLPSADSPAEQAQAAVDPAAEPVAYGSARTFRELPLSQKTQRGLHKHGFTQLTAIQRAAIPHALSGRDVMGAAKTGSGKTLAFLIPVLECLFRARWGSLDGLGALVLSPTRELAIQIFEDLQKVGQEHACSAGLLIGGKKVTEERKHVNRMNILVSTPGRLLQHMDETPGFDCSQLQVLVLDEADRCLDLGFQAALDAILQSLPTDRQTLLFSATQSKRVGDIARLSLKDPEFVAVHADATTATPSRLRQAFLVCPLASKLDLLWFFLKTHQKQRTIVFVATCKQVQFIHECFRRLRPGVPLAMLHGKMKQPQRMAVFYRFNESKAMVLFATDVAARGLDFPTVDWVLQFDCPEDTDAYIHRVGRTARFEAGGDALLFLLPSEKAGMLAALEARRIPLRARTFNAAKVTPVGAALTSLLAASETLKTAAQAAFTSYMRSVFLNPNKGIFNVRALEADAFAASLGLPTVPRLRMVRRMQHGAAAGAQAAGHGDADGAEEGPGVVAGGPSADRARPAQRSGAADGALPCQHVFTTAAAAGSPTSDCDDDASDAGSGGEGSDGLVEATIEEQAAARGKHRRRLMPDHHPAIDTDFGAEQVDDAPANELPGGCSGALGEARHVVDDNEDGVGGDEDDDDDLLRIKRSDVLGVRDSSKSVVEQDAQCVSRQEDWRDVTCHHAGGNAAKRLVKETLGGATGVCAAAAEENGAGVAHARSSEQGMGQEVNEAADAAADSLGRRENDAAGMGDEGGVGALADSRDDGGADGASWQPSKQKRKRVKIREGRPFGSRVCFDREGNEVTPLQALHVANADAKRSCHAAPEAYFEARRAKLKLADEADAAFHRQKRTEARQLKRARQKARQQGDATVPMAVTLRGQGASSDDGASSDSGGGMPDDVTASDRVDPACMDMAPARPRPAELPLEGLKCGKHRSGISVPPAQGASHDHRVGHGRQAGAHRRHGKSEEGMDLAAQEDLVLQLLSSKGV